MIGTLMKLAKCVEIVLSSAVAMLIAPSILIVLLSFAVTTSIAFTSTLTLAIPISAVIMAVVIIVIIIIIPLPLSSFLIISGVTLIPLFVVAIPVRF